MSNTSRINPDDYPGDQILDHPEEWPKQSNNGEANNGSGFQQVPSFANYRSESFERDGKAVTAKIGLSAGRLANELVSLTRAGPNESALTSLSSHLNYCRISSRSG